MENLRVRAQFVAVEYSENGELEKVVFTTRVIEEEMSRLEAFKRLSETDELTLTSNRRVYEKDIKKLNNSDEWNSVSLLTVDVNGLKQANDNLGHKAGDELIVGTAYCLSTVFNSCGKVYRVGGDEFIVLTTAEEDVIKERFVVLNYSMKTWKGDIVDELSFSVGTASVKSLSSDGSGNDVSVKELMQHSDLEMYKEKERHYKESKYDRRSARNA